MCYFLTEVDNTVWTEVLTFNLSVPWHSCGRLFPLNDTILPAYNLDGHVELFITCSVINKTMKYKAKQANISLPGGDIK